MNLSGKTCLVTGANSGLGFEITKLLATHGAETVMLCINEEVGERAILEIKRAVPGTAIELMICDLSSMDSIQSFINAFLKRKTKLDILFNNAAIMKKKRTVTEDGFEMMFQVNYLAPFILMTSFRDILKKGSSPQILNNGLPSDRLRLDMDDLQFIKKYSMYHSFFKTKLCLLFTSLEYSRRYGNDGISTFMADPGPFKSNLVKEVPLAGWFKNLFSSTVDKAAENILYVLTSEIEKNGKVFKEKKEYPLIEYWKDKNVGEQLWSITESLIKG
jgi:NAD(P)-dependent dehydrogenase (short-subunit alcohol dehydrogenase family)